MDDSESRDNIRRLSSAREEALEDVIFSDETSSQSRPSEPPPSAAIRPPSKHSYPFSYHVLALLAPFSMFGLLARLGLQALTNFDGAAVFPLAWVQGMGCLIMGIAAGLREPISQFYAPLYFAIATGFCGSLTTFSSWNLDVFLAWGNAFGFRRVWLYDVIDGLTQILLTLAVSMGALALGLHFANLILPHIPMKLPTVRYPMRYALSILSAVAYILTIPMYFILPHRYRAEATAALLFSFPGALLRHVISIKLNPLNKSFPLGTFTVNILGTLLVGSFHTLQRDNRLWDPASCVMLQALMDGFCGCLSTVSTFAVEIHGLRVRAWVYAGASIFAAQLALVVVTGIPRWAGAISESAKCAFET